MYLGGNGFYWRVAFHDVLPGVMEVRRGEDGTRPWVADPGEYYMAFNGEYGGLWRRNGRPPNTLVGVGFTAQGFDLATYYRRMPGSRDPRAGFIFAGVGDEIIGDFGLGFGGAAGQEIDRHDPALGSPPHALVLATSEGHTDNMLLANEDLNATHMRVGGVEAPEVQADMVFFETGHGGAVFSTGSISWVSALPCNGFDNNVARITQNVVARFVDSQPFAGLERSAAGDGAAARVAVSADIRSCAIPLADLLSPDRQRPTGRSGGVRNPVSGIPVRGGIRAGWASVILPPARRICGACGAGIASRHPLLEPLIGGPVAIATITAITGQWSELVRLKASIETGTAAGFDHQPDSAAAFDRN